MKAFANALDVIPMALAENSGLQGIAEMAKVKAAGVLGDIILILFLFLCSYIIYIYIIYSYSYS